MTTSLGYKFEATAAAEFSDVRAACFQDQRRFRSCACIYAIGDLNGQIGQTPNLLRSLQFGRCKTYTLWKKCVRVWVSDSDEGVEPRLN